MNLPFSYDVIVIGAGASGLFCAIEAAKRGRRVAILEHNEKPGKKILISGGGRANFTNIHTAPSNYVSNNNHFHRSALARYSPSDFVNLVSESRIPYFEKKLGQLFCKNSASELLEMLLSQCKQQRVDIFLSCKPSKIEHSSEFDVHTNQGTFHSQSLVVATGGLSIPKIGATDLGYRIASQFGHELTPTSPALCGLTVDEPIRSLCKNLTGNSVAAIVSCGKHAFEENLLFTHWGFSGPAILQASLYWNPGETIRINLVPNIDLEAFLMEKKKNGEKKLLINSLKEFLPEKFLDQLFYIYNIKNLSLQDASNALIAQIASLLSSWEIRPREAIGYERAEVTRGGVSTDKISSQTMESKLVPKLYFIGEVLDVTGQLGGFNFQWAWASGWVAGQYA